MSAALVVAGVLCWALGVLSLFYSTDGWDAGRDRRAARVSCIFWAAGVIFFAGGLLTWSAL